MIEVFLYFREQTDSKLLIRIPTKKLIITKVRKLSVLTLKYSLGQNRLRVRLHDKVGRWYLLEPPSRDYITKRKTQKNLKIQIR